MTRSSDDRRRLNDSTQLALAVAAAVTLGLPWRTDRGSGPNPQSGWADLDSAAHGVGWLLIVGTAVAMVALVVDRRPLHVVASVVSALALAVLVLGIGASMNLSSVELHSGVVVGAVLLAGSAASRAYAAVLARRQPDGFNR